MGQGKQPGHDLEVATFGHKRQLRLDQMIVWESQNRDLWTGEPLQGIDLQQALKEKQRAAWNRGLRKGS